MDPLCSAASRSASIGVLRAGMERRWRWHHAAKANHRAHREKRESTEIPPTRSGLVRRARLQIKTARLLRKLPKSCANKFGQQGKTIHAGSPAKVRNANGGRKSKKLTWACRWQHQRNSRESSYQPRVWRRSFSSSWRTSRPFMASPSSSLASRTILGSL